MSILPSTRTRGGYGTSSPPDPTAPAPTTSTTKLRRDSTAPLMHTLPIPTSSNQSSLSTSPLHKDSPSSYSSRGRSGLYRRRRKTHHPVQNLETEQSDVELNTSDEPGGDSDFSESDSSGSEDDEDDEEEGTRDFLSLIQNRQGEVRISGLGSNQERWQQKLILTEEDVEINIEGYRFNSLRYISYKLACLFTLGVVWLVCRWVPKWWVSWVGQKVDLKDASWLVFVNQYGERQIIRPLREKVSCTVGSVFSLEQIKEEMRENRVELEDIPRYTNMDETIDQLILVDYRYVRLAYHPLFQKYLIVGFWKDQAWSMVKNMKSGLQAEKCYERLAIFGPNLINIREKPTAKLLTDEVLNPFYVFQIGSIILWSMDDYYYYAFCIFFISAVSIISTLVETKQTMKRMREMSRFECSVRAFRSGAWRTVSSTELVPGDLIDIADLHTVPCDAVLISGDCILNESMLTGESVPVSKAPITDITLRKVNLSGPTIPAEVAKHFLFMGTKVVRVRSGVNVSAATAVVVRTGFNTAKGALIRSMLFPKPNNFKFYRDSFRFIGILSIIAVFGFMLSSVNFIRLGIDTTTMILRALDLITIVVPPALPATMSIGTSFAISRLKKIGIFCISPPRVNMGGKIDCMCFDKTGTLTEDGLDIYSIRAVETRADGTKLFGQETDSVARVDPNSESDVSTESRILRTMTTCHSLKIVRGELLGDPLDLKMFEFTRWELEESNGISSSDLKPTTSELLGSQAKKIAKVGIMPTVVRPPGGRHELVLPTDRLETPPIEFGIIHSFEFVSALRRMSVIVRRLANPCMEVFVKGAPEVMVDICRPETMPADFQERLYWYTHRGYRVIACASRQLEDVKWHKLHKLKRQDVESNLTFLGFIIFENKLKPRTISAIATLRSANIRQIMCTGDNVLTAVSVSRECGLVDQGSEIYIPKFLKGSSTEPDSQLTWESVLHEGDELDRDTLQPRRRTADYYSQPYGNEQAYHLAVTGEAFRWVVDHAPVELLHRMLVKGAVYARMSPDEKAELVVELQNIGYCVGFCGDGANDCGALKAGDIGISLSEAEASVAAPFTSNTMDINCVIDVIKEGRAALVTSFSCFKYMALYSIIQFTSVTLLYAFGSNLGDFQFLYIDLFLILPIAVYMGYTAAWPHLYQKRPTASLVSKKVLTSLVGQIVINSGFQFIAYWAVHQQDWYVPPVFDPDGENIMCYENTVLFLLSSFQYILVAVVFSVGPPYRKPLWTNGRLVLTLVVLVALTVWCVLYPNEFLRELLELETIPFGFRVFVIFLAVVNLVISYTCEKYVFLRLAGWLSQIMRFLRSKSDYSPVGKPQRKIYKRVGEEMGIINL
ncbi:putative P-type ATPase [Phycomyces nitens]|nr:putative P-type ATPase [Phycomyces nitens]